jgi:hypothetical protein
MKTNQPRQLRVLLALLYYPVMIFLQTARDIVTAMTGNANYATPFPTLADIGTALDDLEAKITAAAGRDLVAIAARNVSWQTAKTLLRQLAGYVQMQCQNDLEILLTSGFRATKTPGPIGLLAPPENLSILYRKSGEVLLSMDAIRGTTGGYPIEQSEDGGPWTGLLNSPKARLVEITGLTPTKTYRLRAAAVGTKGQSGWSNPVEFIAL